MMEFPIGFWNYIGIGHLDKISVDDWKDFGCTFAMSPIIRGEKNNEEEKKRMIEFLDECYKKDIKIYITDTRVLFNRLEQIGEKEYIEGVREAVEDYGKHPAVLGFHIGDEPLKGNYEYACRAAKINKEIAPGLVPFLNLNHYRKSVLENNTDFGTWDEYLDQYVKDSNADFLSYDCYYQMRPDKKDWNVYFENLRIYMEAAKRNNIPFWTTLLSVGHFRYRCPNEDEIRWQVNTAVAHGAKGIMWYKMYLLRPFLNYRLAPIDEHWQKTETFCWIRRTNKSFAQHHGPVLMELELKKVFHGENAYGGFPLFEKYKYIKKATNEGKDFILSIFEDKDKNEYICFVNNCTDNDAKAQIYLDKIKNNIYFVDWKNRLRPAKDNPYYYKEHDDEIELTHISAPGQMAMWKIEKTD